MAYTLITNVNGRSTNQNDVTTATADSTGADLLVYGLASDNAKNADGTISDSKSNTINGLTAAQTPDNTLAARIYYAAGAITVGGSHTATYSKTGSYPSLGMAAFSGAAASPADLESNGGSNSAASIQAGAGFTPSEANCLVIAILDTFDDRTGTLAIDGGFTILDNVAPTANAMGYAIAYLIQTSAAAANPTWSWTGTTFCRAALASFKAAGGAPPAFIQKNGIFVPQGVNRAGTY